MARRKPLLAAVLLRHAAGAAVIAASLGGPTTADAMTPQEQFMEGNGAFGGVVLGASAGTLLWSGLFWLLFA